jgi:rhodanese-related sulfurtransferase
MDGSKAPTAISASDLYAAIGTAAAPLVVDVRPEQVFAAEQSILVAALRRDPEEMRRWSSELPKNRHVVLYCADGRSLGPALAAALRGAGVAACHLEGGIAAWVEHRFPTHRKLAAGEQGWITRERPKIDRIACPWLIRRFIDPQASFLYVPTEEVFAVAGTTGATPYDIPGAEPFAHEGELCSFDMFLRAYGIRDSALDALALIVRGADTARPELAPEAPGLLALSRGLSANFENDHDMLQQGLTMYDALYAWCRSGREPQARGRAR